VDSEIYLKQTKEIKRPPMSRYTRTVLSLAVADAILVLFLTFGAVFPSRLSIPDAGDAMPEEFYDYTAKISPFQVPANDQKRTKVTIPVFSARSLPLLSSLQAQPEPAQYHASDSEYPIRASFAVASDFDRP
jgi:hypothetical protein